MSTSPSSFLGPREGPPDRSKTMFPDLTRDDVFRLETRRLWLRWPRLADVQALVRLAGEKAVAEMTGRIPHPYTPEHADRFVFETRRNNANGHGLTLVITPKGRPNAAIGAVGIAGNASSIPLAMNKPGTVYSCPLSCEKWICHRSSRPGDEKIVFITSGCPPLRVPSFMIATRGRSAWTSTSEFDVSCP